MLSTIPPGVFTAAGLLLAVALVWWLGRERRR